MGCSLTRRGVQDHNAAMGYKAGSFSVLEVACHGEMVTRGQLCLFFFPQISMTVKRELDLGPPSSLRLDTAHPSEHTCNYFPESLTKCILEMGREPRASQGTDASTQDTAFL